MALLSKQCFFMLPIPELIMNLYDYKYQLHDPVVNQYAVWCVKVLGEKWNLDRFLDLDYDVVKDILNNASDFKKFAQILPATINVVYNVILKEKIFYVLD